MIKHFINILQIYMENITVQENKHKILMEWAKNKCLKANFIKMTLQNLNLKETYNQIPNPIRLPKHEIPFFFFLETEVL